MNMNDLKLGNKTMKLECSLSAFTDAYIECAAWTNEEELENAAGFADETYAKMRKDCLNFFLVNEERVANPDNYIGGCISCVAMAGHDFWLTRNGHGAGFWDGDWLDEVGKELTKASEAFGAFDLYLGDDSRVYGE